MGLDRWMGLDSKWVLDVLCRFFHQVGLGCYSDSVHLFLHTSFTFLYCLLLDKMKINGDDWEDREDDVCWDRFDDIIRHYICQYKQKMYGVDGNELTNEFRPASCGG